MLTIYSVQSVQKVCLPTFLVLGWSAVGGVERAGQRHSGPGVSLDKHYQSLDYNFKFIAANVQLYKSYCGCVCLFAYPLFS